MNKKIAAVVLLGISLSLNGVCVGEGPPRNQKFKRLWKKWDRNTDRFEKCFTAFLLLGITGWAAYCNFIKDSGFTVEIIQEPDMSWQRQIECKNRFNWCGSISCDGGLIRDQKSQEQIGRACIVRKIDLHCLLTQFAEAKHDDTGACLVQINAADLAALNADAHECIVASLQDDAEFTFLPSGETPTYPFPTFADLRDPYKEIKAACVLKKPENNVNGLLILPKESEVQCDE